MCVWLDQTISLAVQAWVQACQSNRSAQRVVMLHGKDKIYLHLLRCIGVSEQYANHLTQPHLVPQLTDADAQRFPLFVAAIMGNSICTLVRAGSDVNERDNAGFTPLHYAVVFGNTHTMDALIAADAHLGAVESVDVPLTLWDVAARTGNPAVCNALGRAIESAHKRNAEKWERILRESVYFASMPIEIHCLIASFIPLASADYAGIRLGDLRAHVAAQTR